MPAPSGRSGAVGALSVMPCTSSVIRTVWLRGMPGTNSHPLLVQIHAKVVAAASAQRLHLQEHSAVTCSLGRGDGELQARPSSLGPDPWPSRTGLGCAVHRATAFSASQHPCLALSLRFLRYLSRTRPLQRGGGLTHRVRAGPWAPEG
jgi:hypothetical protein